jgi:hypothetical protein
MRAPRFGGLDESPEPTADELIEAVEAELDDHEGREGDTLE